MVRNVINIRLLFRGSVYRNEGGSEIRTGGSVGLDYALFPLIIDILWNGIRFLGLEILLVVAVLSSSSIFRSSENYTPNSFKEKYLLSISFNLSSTFLYLVLIFIYSSVFYNNINFLDWKDIASSFLSRIPDLVSRIFLILPLLFSLTILTTNFLNMRKGIHEFEEDILDSNLFN